MGGSGGGRGPFHWLIYSILIASRDPTSPSANQAPGEQDIVDRMYVLMYGCLVGWFVGWLAFSLVGWLLVGWLVVVWLVGWLVGCWLARWLFVFFCWLLLGSLLVGRLVGWLVGRCVTKVLTKPSQIGAKIDPESIKWRPGGTPRGGKKTEMEKHSKPLTLSSSWGRFWRKNGS